MVLFCHLIFYSVRTNSTFPEYVAQFLDSLRLKSRLVDGFKVFVHVYPWFFSPTCGDDPSWAYFSNRLLATINEEKKPWTKQKAHRWAIHGTIMEPRPKFEVPRIRTKCKNIFDVSGARKWPCWVLGYGGFFLVAINDDRMMNSKCSGCEVFFLSLGYRLIVHPDCLVLLMTHWNGHIGWFQLAASSAWTEAKPPVRDVLRWIWPFATVRRCGVIKWYKLASWCKLFSTSLLFRIPKRTLKLLPISRYMCVCELQQRYTSMVIRFVDICGGYHF